MSNLRLLTTTAGLVLLMAVPALASPRSRNAEQIAARLLQAYIAAWDRADAEGIARQFAKDGDFINPTGYLAVGPDQVRAFYGAAFARGYAGSRGNFEAKRVRRLSPDTIAVDGEWSISGARETNGASRTPEAGIATAILVKKQEGWRVGLLREQSGARHISR